VENLEVLLKDGEEKNVQIPQKEGRLSEFVTSCVITAF
jgi:hypothetical protein